MTRFTSFQKALAAMAAATVLAGCAGVPANFAGNSVTDRSQIDLAKGRKVSAKASGFQLLVFIPIAINGRQNNAYAALLKEAGDDSVLSDITVTESWTYALVGTIFTTTIEATAYPRSTAPGK